MFRYYILGEDGRTPIETHDRAEGAKCFEDIGRRIVAKNTIGEITISTVFL